MIQRKQTVFLFLAIVCMVVCLCMPLATVEPQAMGVSGAMYNLWIDGAQGRSFAVCPLFVVAVLACALQAVAIGLYKNRKVQSRVCVWAMLLLVAWMVAYAVFFHTMADGVTLRVSMGAAFPIVAFVLTLMAKRGVDADERLVRAADRIR